MKKRTVTVLLASLAGSLAASVGCGEGVLPESGAVVYHSPARVESPRPESIAVAERRLTPEQQEQYGAILESFEQNAPTLLRRADIEARLEQIETVFIVSGRYFDLLAIFQEDVRTHGLETPAAPALVWGYLQLGQRKLARQMLDDMIAAFSDAPLVWILDGSYWLMDAETSQTAARRAVESFRKALAISPNFPTFRRMSPAVIQQQIRELERRLPAEANVEAVVEPAVEADIVEPGEVEEAVVEEAVVEEAVAEVPAAEEPEVEQPVVEEPQASAGPSAAVLVARGQLLMARGDDQLAEAQRLFQQALAVDPEHLDAAMGLLYVAARSGAPDAMLRAQVERIEGYDHLTARQAYDLGLFSARTLKNRDLATRLLTRSRDLDAAHAERVGIARLLESL
jgi:tetratricopeptide (TPR) repeat protein